MVKEKIVDPDAFLRAIYQEAILEKLKNYKILAKKVRAKIKDYKQRSKSNLPTSRSFEQKWVKRDIPDLDYVVVTG